MTFLILTLGISPMASVWAGNMSSSEQSEMAMGSTHDHSAMMAAASDDADAVQSNHINGKHCDMNATGNCDSDCCSSGT